MSNENAKCPTCHGDKSTVFYEDGFLHRKPCKTCEGTGQSPHALQSLPGGRPDAAPEPTLTGHRLDQKQTVEREREPVVEVTKWQVEVFDPNYRKWSPFQERHEFLHLADEQLGKLDDNFPSYDFRLVEVVERRTVFKEIRRTAAERAELSSIWEDEVSPPVASGAGSSDRATAGVGDGDAHGAKGCPMCGAEVEWVETEESFKHAGSTYWRTVVGTLCDCFQERWGWGDYGTKKTVQAEALTIWNRRPESASSPTEGRSSASTPSVDSTQNIQ